jgi:hypothetical protein
MSAVLKEAVERIEHEGEQRVVEQNELSGVDGISDWSQWSRR